MEWVIKNSRKGDRKCKERKETLANINWLFNVRENVIQMFHDYAKISSEVRYKANKEEQVEILILKQMLQRLTIVL